MKLLKNELEYLKMIFFVELLLTLSHINEVLRGFLRLQITLDSQICHLIALAV